jgi:hypothetical protein
MSSREKLKIATLGSSSWMPYAPRVKGTDDDDDDESTPCTGQDRP